MRRAGCRHLPVLAEGRVLGMISMRDLLRDELEEERQEVRELRAYLHQAPLDELAASSFVDGGRAAASRRRYMRASSRDGIALEGRAPTRARASSARPRV